MRAAPDGFRSRTAPTRVWLVRHGLSTFNFQRLYQGCCDQPELTDRGRLSAQLIAQALSGANIGLLVSSPLRRALATTHEIIDEFRRRGLPAPKVRTDDRLKEIDLPEWRGLGYEEVKNRFPDQYGTWRSEPHRLRILQESGGKAFPVLDLFERARLFWTDLLSNANVNEVLVVAHGGSLRALISVAIGMGPERFHCLQLSHGSISVIDFPSSAARPCLETLNSVNHLGEILPKAKAGKTGYRLVVIPFDGESVTVEQITARLQVLLRADWVVPRLSARDCGSLRETIASAGGTGLRTVLSTVPQQEFSAALASLLPIDREASACFQPQSPRVTVIHYPGGDEPVVLQAVNLFHDVGQGDDPRLVREDGRCACRHWSQEPPTLSGSTPRPRKECWPTGRRYLRESGARLDCSTAETPRPGHSRREIKNEISWRFEVGEPGLRCVRGRKRVSSGCRQNS